MHVSTMYRNPSVADSKPILESYLERAELLEQFRRGLYFTASIFRAWTLKSWNILPLVQMLTIYWKICPVFLGLLYWQCTGKNKLEKTCPKQFSDSCVLLWVWEQIKTTKIKIYEMYSVCFRSLYSEHCILTPCRVAWGHGGRMQSGNVRRIADHICTSDLSCISRIVVCDTISTSLVAILDCH